MYDSTDDYLKKILQTSKKYYEYIFKNSIHISH